MRPSSRPCLLLSRRDSPFPSDTSTTRSLSLSLNRITLKSAPSIMPSAAPPPSPPAHRSNKAQCGPHWPVSPRRRDSELARKRDGSDSVLGSRPVFRTPSRCGPRMANFRAMRSSSRSMFSPGCRKTGISNKCGSGSCVRDGDYTDKWDYFRVDDQPTGAKKMR